jgi:hypothetical protein
MFAWSRALPPVAAVAALSLLAALPAPRASSQEPVSTALIALGGKLLVKDILSDAEKKADTLIGKAKNSADMVALHATSELHLMIENLRVAFADSQAKAFGDLTIEQQRLFTNLNNTIERIVDEDTVRKSIEQFELGISETVRRTVLAKSGTDFYISSVRGTLLAEQDNDYEVRVAGLGFGYNVKGSSDAQSVVDVSVNGKDLDWSCIHQKEAHVVVVKIPAKRLKGLFEDSKVVRTEFVFTCTIPDGKKKKTYEVKIPLFLLPRVAGSVTIEQVIETKVWGNPQTKTITLTRDEKGAAQDRTEKWTCASNQRIVGVTYECKHPKGGWSTALRDGPDGYRADYDITDGGKTAVVYRRITYWPMSCHYNVKYETQTPGSETVKAGTGTYSLKYDEQFAVMLSPENRNGNFKLTGKLFDGRKIAMNSETASGNKSPFRLIGSGKVGECVRLTFVLKSNAKGE